MGTVTATREARCAHDMLEWPDLGLTSCSICKGLPWEVRGPIDTPNAVDDRPLPSLRWFVVGQYEDRREACVRCDEPLRAGDRVAWSRDEGGTICAACAAEVAAA